MTEARTDATGGTSGGGDPRARALAHLQNIGVRALASNLRRVGELDEALRLVTRGGLSDAQRMAAVDTAHQLVGSAGTFGYERVSAVARRVEEYFKAGAPDDEVSTKAATDELSQIRQDLDSGPDDDLESD